MISEICCEIIWMCCATDMCTERYRKYFILSMSNKDILCRIFRCSNISNKMFEGSIELFQKVTCIQIIPWCLVTGWGLWCGFTKHKLLVLFVCLLQGTWWSYTVRDKFFCNSSQGRYYINEIEHWAFHIAEGIYREWLSMKIRFCTAVPVIWYRSYMQWKTSFSVSTCSERRAFLHLFSSFLGRDYIRKIAQSVFSIYKKCTKETVLSKKISKKWMHLYIVHCAWTLWKIFFLQ